MNKRIGAHMVIMLREHVIAISTISRIKCIIQNAGCSSVWWLPYTQPSNLIVIMYLLANVLPFLTPVATTAILLSNSMNSQFLHFPHVRSCGVCLSVPDVYVSCSNRQGFHPIYSWRTLYPIWTMFSLLIPWQVFRLILYISSCEYYYNKRGSSYRSLTYWSDNAPLGTFSLSICHCL